MQLRGTPTIIGLTALDKSHADCIEMKKKLHLKAGAFQFSTKIIVGDATKFSFHAIRAFLCNFPP
jgi:hypothetical protein